MEQEAKAALAERIAAQRAGVGDPRALVGEMRRAALLVPMVNAALWTARWGGVRWICGFTDEEALARFAELRSPGLVQQPWDYAVLLGARIVDEIIPAMGEPAGLAVDIATEDGAMVFPPVTGIVPDAVAVDVVGPGVDGGRG